MRAGSGQHTWSAAAAKRGPCYRHPLAGAIHEGKQKPQANQLGVAEQSVVVVLLVVVLLVLVVLVVTLAVSFVLLVLPVAAGGYRLGGYAVTAGPSLSCHALALAPAAAARAVTSALAPGTARARLPCPSRRLRTSLTRRARAVGGGPSFGAGTGATLQGTAPPPACLQV